MIVKIIVFILGSVIGSFLNVCIWRLPRSESIIFPPSHCINCGNDIRWYDNIPLVSFIMLGARCRYCGRPISPRYFLVELITASLFLSFYILFGITPRFFAMSILGFAMIASTFIDFEHEIIPDVITIPGIITGLVVSAAFPSAIGQQTAAAAALQSLYGALAGGLSIYLLGAAGKALFKKESMGGGDVKFLAMVGSFLGWRLTLLTFFVAPFFGSVVGIVLKIRYNRQTIPYGPYLSIAVLISMVWGANILDYLFF